GGPVLGGAVLPRVLLRRAAQRLVAVAIGPALRSGVRPGPRPHRSHRGDSARRPRRRAGVALQQDGIALARHLCPLHQQRSGDQLRDLAVLSGDGEAGRPPAVVAHDLRKSYGDRPAVAGIDFEVGPGICFGFLGPNGAGKTTTMKMIYGLATVDGGELLVLGMDASRPPRESKSRPPVVPP